MLNEDFLEFIQPIIKKSLNSDKKLKELLPKINHKNYKDIGDAISDVAVLANKSDIQAPDHEKIKDVINNLDKRTKDAIESYLSNHDIGYEDIETHEEYIELYHSAAAVYIATDLLNPKVFEENPDLLVQLSIPANANAMMMCVADVYTKKCKNILNEMKGIIEDCCKSEIIKEKKFIEEIDKIENQFKKELKKELGTDNETKSEINDEVANMMVNYSLYSLIKKYKDRHELTDIQLEKLNSLESTILEKSLNNPFNKTFSSQDIDTAMKKYGKIRENYVYKTGRTLSTGELTNETLNGSYHVHHLLPKSLFPDVAADMSNFVVLDQTTHLDVFHDSNNTNGFSPEALEYGFFLKWYEATKELSDINELEELRLNNRFDGKLPKKLGLLPMLDKAFETNTFSKMDYYDAYEPEKFIKKFKEEFVKYVNNLEEKGKAPKALKTAAEYYNEHLNDRIFDNKFVKNTIISQDLVDSKLYGKTYDEKLILISENPKKYLTPKLLSSFSDHPFHDLDLDAGAIIENFLTDVSKKSEREYSVDDLKLICKENKIVPELNNKYNDKVHEIDPESNIKELVDMPPNNIKWLPENLKAIVTNYNREKEVQMYSFYEDEIVKPTLEKLKNHSEYGDNIADYYDEIKEEIMSKFDTEGFKPVNIEKFIIDSIEEDGRFQDYSTDYER